MNCKIVFRMTLLRLLVSSLGLAASCTLLCAQEKPQPDTKPRLSVGVLIDTSAHQKKVIEFEREVLNSIADAFAGVATDGFVLRYADKVETLQDWSPLGTGLRTVSPRIELDVESGKNQRTLLYDAFYVGLLKLDNENSAKSKALIIIGEGNDSGSHLRVAQLKQLAKSNHVQCFVLLVADHNLMGGRERHFGFNLYDLASATEGKAYDVGDSRKNLDKAIQDLVKRVR
ncbi:MAG TPA: hypothetical protein VHF01_04400 [Candidatus Acidoferrum sp.]|nr:hypothetical protein [Candidatus Acidoferrum sp.]